MDLIRPEPLERPEAARLVAEPLADLGLALEHAGELHARIYHLTSGLPHLIQGIAHRLLQRAHRTDAHTVTPADLAAVEQDFLGHMVNLLPLRDLEDDQSRLAALLLLHDNPPEVRVGTLADRLAAAGCPVELQTHTPSVSRAVSGCAPWLGAGSPTADRQDALSDFPDIR